ncbi:hypothetical protein HY638_05495 [Candidatus Woesearchaeota archaeon]|nr:hypothetical protein [Candidatus Woesearchaeota archaeon]
MAVVGFGFNRIEVKKSDIAKTGKINISNNVSLTNIEQQDVTLGKEKQITLKFSFEFTSKYEPDVGSILIAGTSLFLSDSKRSKEIIDSWKKDKKVPKDVMTEILNTVLMKCNIQALILSQDVNLPPPIPLPKVRPEAPKE